MDQPDRTRRAGLRLQRHDARAEPAEGRDPVADMRADIEGEIAGLQELRHTARPSPALRAGIAMIDPQRARQRLGRTLGKGDAGHHAVRPRCEWRGARPAARNPPGCRRARPLANQSPERRQRRDHREGDRQHIAGRQRQGPDQHGRRQHRERPEDVEAEQEMRPQPGKSRGEATAHGHRAPGRSSRFCARPKARPTMNSVVRKVETAPCRKAKTISISEDSDEPPGAAIARRAAPRAAGYRQSPRASATRYMPKNRT